MECDQVRHVQPHNYGARAVKPLSPEYPVSQQPRSRHGFPASIDPDRDFIHSFSQSRLDGPSSQSRDGFTVLSETSRHNGLDRGNKYQYGEQPSRPVIPETALRARSPQYVERSM